MLPNSKEIQLRQFILDEFEVKNNIKQAVKNIRLKLGRGTVKPTKVKWWYRCFKKGNKSLTKANLQPSTSSSSNSYLDCYQLTNLPNALFQLKNIPFQTTRMISNDGQIGIIPVENSLSFHAIDLLRGKFRILRYQGGPLSSSFYSMKMIDDEHILISTSSSPTIFALLKLDYKFLKVIFLHKIEIQTVEFRCKLILDQLDSRKFINYFNDGSFLLGSVNSANIIAGNVIQSDLGNLRFINLIGQKLYGLRFSDQWNFFEFDLDTMRLTRTTKLSLEFDDDENIYDRDYSNINYVWHKSRLYFSTIDSGGLTKIYSFNADNGVCTYTNILLSNFLMFKGLFIDNDESLTVLAYQYSELDYKACTLYKFPLKKPEKLKNLVWTSTVRFSKLSGNKLYKDFINNLPYDYDIRCQFLRESKSPPKNMIDLIEL